MLVAAVGLAVAAGVVVSVVSPAGRAALVSGVSWLKGAGAVGLAIAVGAAVVGIPLGVPTLWFAALIGYLYGPIAGPPIALAAALGGATGAFGVGRRLLRSRVARLVARRRRWRAVVDALGDGGAGLVALLRLCGPHNLLNYVLSASSLTLGQFVVGTVFGSLPSVALASVGGAMVHDAAALWLALDQLGPASAIILIAGAIALVLAIVVMVRATRRALAGRGVADAVSRDVVSYNDEVAPARDTSPMIRHTDEMEWQPSPSPTVWRKRLELDGPAEAGRVTSVVRYLPDASFPPHPHPDGEEILVLDGVFTDQTGDHGAGSYLLNPEGFEHGPSSGPGCILLVKLRQYPGAGREVVRVDSARAVWSPHAVAGVEVLELYRSDDHPEEMRLVRIAAGADVPAQGFPRGEEIFVVDGSFRDEHGAYRAGSWVKYPPGGEHTPRSDGGCTLYVKKGHLGG